MPKLLTLAAFLAKTPHEVIGLVIRVRNDQDAKLPEEIELTIPASADEIRDFLKS